MAWKKLPKNFGTTGKQQSTKGTRHMDALDREACAEGDAIKSFRSEFSGSAPLGRRITKQRVGETRGKVIMGNKRVANLTKDHAAAIEKYTHKES